MIVEINVWYKVKKADTRMFLNDCLKFNYHETFFTYNVMNGVNMDWYMFSVTQVLGDVYLVAKPINGSAVDYNPWKDVDFV